MMGKIDLMLRKGIGANVLPLEQCYHVNQR